MTSFLILYAQSKEEQKLKFLIRAIEQEDDLEQPKEETEISDEARMFYNRDPKMLKIFVLIFSGWILPFIEFTKEELNLQKDFRDFELSATTNPQIFTDFAKHIAQNFLFERDSISEYSGRHQNLIFIGSRKRILTKKQFLAILKEEYRYVLEPKFIRQKFIEFVDQHETKAFKRPSIFARNQSIVPDSVNLSIRGNFLMEW